VIAVTDYGSPQTVNFVTAFFQRLTGMLERCCERVEPTKNYEGSWQDALVRSIFRMVLAQKIFKGHHEPCTKLEGDSWWNDTAATNE
jgi:hypothetical protein